MSDKLKSLAQEACHALQVSLRYLEEALDSAKAKGAPDMAWKVLEEDVVDHKELIADLEKALAEEQIKEWWASEHGLEDCVMCRLVDFKQVVRAVEKKVAS